MSILKRIQGADSNVNPPPSNSGGGPPSLQTRRVTAPASTAALDTYQDLKTRVQNKLLAGLDPGMDPSRTAEIRRTIQELFEQILNEENIVLSRPERARMFEQIAAEILGFGPLSTLLDDESITEVMVNGAKNIYIERRGKIIRVPVSFESNEHVMRIIDRIVSPLGRRIDESMPYVDARLPDGSRVNVVTLESRAANIEGKGEVTIRQLVVNALRMRPDRIIVGEIRDEAALDMLQAMNTGHDGSMTTLHSNGPRDTIARLETMVLMAGMDLPIRAIREQVASAIELVIHQERMRDGTRKVVNITEVTGMEGDVITMTDIFQFEQVGYENGKVVGRLRPTGLRPKFVEKIESAGIHLPSTIFGVGDRRRY